MGSSRLDLLLHRSYRRLRSKYMLVIAAVGVVNAVGSAGIAVIMSLDTLDASSGQIRDTGLVALVLCMLSIGTLYRLAKPRFNDALVWVREPGSEADGPSLWRTVTREIDWLLRTGVIVFSVWFLPFPIFAWRYLDQPAWVIPLAFVVVELTIVFAATLDYFAVNRMLRPILRELGPSLPLDFEPGYSTAPLSMRIMAVPTVVGVFGAYVAANTSRSGSPAVQVAISVGVAVATVCVVGIPAALLLAESIVSPLTGLMKAARRIEEGDFSVRVPLMGADEVGLLSANFNRMAHGLQEREALRNAFGSYIDPVVANRVLEQGEMLEGVQRRVSVMFVDIRGFTSRSERQTPEQTVRMLNEYFELVVPIVERHGGFVNKFLGDGFLAVFGAPVPLEDHADRAIRCARELVDAVAVLYGEGLSIGIGINTGPVIVGSVGGGGRLEFGLIGDVVNVAARVEELTKSLGESILATESTVRSIPHQPEHVAPIGPTEIRGRHEPVQLHAVR